MKNLFLTSALIFCPLFVHAVPEKVSVEEILNLPAENRKLAALENKATITADLRKFAHDAKLAMSTRWKALMLLTEISPREAINDLMLSSRSPDWFMRNASLVGLESVNHEKALDVAQGLIMDKALVVRSAAVDVMAKSLGPANRDLFWQELFKSYNYRAGSSLWIRGQMLVALAAKPLDREAKIFAQLLKEKDAQIQLASVRALEKLQGVKLGSDKSTPNQIVALWQDYAKKNSL